MPARLFGEPVNLGQTEPRASADILCREERLKHMRQYRGIDANAVVADRNQYKFTRYGVCILVGVGLVEQDIPGLYDNPTTIRQRVARIDHKIQERRLELCAIDSARVERGVEL